MNRLQQPRDLDGTTTKRMEKSAVLRAGIFETEHFKALRRIHERRDYLAGLSRPVILNVMEIPKCFLFQFLLEFNPLAVFKPLAIPEN
tara:strand:- start:1443 stop:1706 length:264 start_codon:yes stop_codon:yes gene_type:complete